MGAPSVLPGGSNGGAPPSGVQRPLRPLRVSPEEPKAHSAGEHTRNVGDRNERVPQAQPIQRPAARGHEGADGQREGQTAHGAAARRPHHGSQRTAVHSHGEGAAQQPEALRAAAAVSEGGEGGDGGGQQREQSGHAEQHCRLGGAVVAVHRDVKALQRRPDPIDGH